MSFNIATIENIADAIRIAATVMHPVTQETERGWHNVIGCDNPIT